MPPIANASKRKKHSPSGFGSLRLPILFVVLGLLLGLFFTYISATFIAGTEFNSATWSVRDFHYRRDPFTKKQLIGIVRGTPSGILTSPPNFPLSYFTASPQTSRWDLVEINHGRTSSDGPAKILLTYLQTKGGPTTHFWPDWSSKNPVKATVLWNAVRDLVDLELYRDLPSILELAVTDCSDKEFGSMINTNMQAAIQRYRDQLELSGETELSNEVVKYHTRYQTTTQSSSSK
jgi:hypothetical protein